MHENSAGTDLARSARQHRLGAIFEKKANWQPYSITDGLLITGQNPESSTSTAQALMKLVAK